MQTKKNKLCFVLMPFKDELKDVYSKAIKPACAKAGFDSLRVDELTGTFNINRKIIEHIFISDAIVADLTDWNPNVFYEMGVAHAIDNKTIMIIQKKDKVPFDVGTYNCILYEHNEAGLEKLLDGIVESLTSLDEWRQHPTNPVHEFKPFEAFIPRSIIEKKEAIISALYKQVDQLRLQLTDKRALVKSPLASPQAQLRSYPVHELSKGDVALMLKEKDFFDKTLNESGKGLQHDFQIIGHDDNRLIFDSTTGLTWQQSGSLNHMKTSDAEEYILGLNQKLFAGYNDWRLPTLEEAMSLVEPRKRGELYIDPLFDRKQKWIWTNDNKLLDEGWVVNFAGGFCEAYLSDCSHYVRAVR